VKVYITEHESFLINENKMNTKFIHVGCHKCGSTFLQREVFPKLKNIKTLTFVEENPLSEEINYLTQCGELYYKHSYVEKNIHEKLKDFDDICLSSEGFSGTNNFILGTGHQIKYIASRLKRIFGKTKILIIIRNQKKSLPSLYKDDIKYGYLLDFKQWIQYRYDSCSLNYFKYSYLIECYQKYFGIDNVKVVLFESLFNKQTFDQLSIDLNINPSFIESINLKRKFNESYTWPSLIVAKLLNRHFGSKLTHGVTFGKSNSLRIYNWWRYNYSRKIDRLSKIVGINDPNYDFENYNNILYELYHDDNKRVSKLLNVNLLDYNYV